MKTMNLNPKVKLKAQAMKVHPNQKNQMKKAMKTVKAPMKKTAMKMKEKTKVNSKIH